METTLSSVNEQFDAIAANMPDLQAAGGQIIEATEAQDAVPFGQFEDAHGEHARLIVLGERGILTSVDSGTGEEQHEGDNWLAAHDDSVTSDIKQLA